MPCGEHKSSLPSRPASSTWTQKNKRCRRPSTKLSNKLIELVANPKYLPVALASPWHPRSSGISVNHAKIWAIMKTCSPIDHWHGSLAHTCVILGHGDPKGGGWIGSLKPILWLFLIYNRKNIILVLVCSIDPNPQRVLQPRQSYQLAYITCPKHQMGCTKACHGYTQGAWLGR